MSKGSRLSRDVVIVGDILCDTPGQIQRALQASVSYTNKASALVLGTIPAGAILIGMAVKVLTVSNAGTTGVLNVGFSGGTGVELVNGQDVKTATGTFTALGNTTQVGTALSAAKVVTAQYADTGTAATAGIFFVVLEYVTI